eukprot:scaffold1509_cov240-Pinguiococcus_pyrenoidosus.AAC.43
MSKVFSMGRWQRSPGSTRQKSPEGAAFASTAREGKTSSALPARSLSRDPSIARRARRTAVAGAGNATSASSLKSASRHLQAIFTHPAASLRLAACTRLCSSSRYAGRLSTAPSDLGGPPWCELCTSLSCAKSASRTAMPLRTFRQRPRKYASVSQRHW